MGNMLDLFLFRKTTLLNLEIMKMGNIYDICLCIYIYAYDLYLQIWYLYNILIQVVFEHKKHVNVQTVPKTILTQD